MNPNVTIVTGLWDLGRGQLDGWAKRDFQQYKERFFDLLKCDAQMCIWIPKDLEQDVLAIRGNKPTKIYIKNVEDFKTWFPFFDKTQEIRKWPEWLNQAGWLAESPQAALEYYNPMMMCKMFMLNDTTIFNPFKSQYFFWMDGGLTSTVNTGYFAEDKVLDKLDSYCLENKNKLIHITYPYTCNTEIHGFERKSMAAFCNTEFVDYVARGGFFGGHRQRINEMNSLYYGVLADTFAANVMGADECLFTILCHKYPEKIHRFNIEGNGLVWPFFEMLKHYVPAEKLYDPDKIALYVITFNSPEQFEALIQTYLKHSDFITNTENYLLDNSTDASTEPRYIELCEKYKFTRIKRDNIGICGGRQFIAEHFAGIDAKYYIFLEDDMNLVDPNVTLSCSSGFARFTPNLLQKVKAIMEKENYDFLKFSFKEFFGDNSVQWAWYNVPQRIRDEFFPEKTTLPEHGFDPNAPKLIYKNIKSIDGLAYADGEIYYCNWPQIVSKTGNQKLFLDTKWSHPYEQTWMSHFFQETKKGLLRGAVLLLSPVEHHRFKFYPKEQRREN